MIKNSEFKKLKNYKEILKNSDKDGFFDQYSIIKSFVKNISNGKNDLLEHMSFDDDYHLQALFEDVSGLELLSDDCFKIGNPKTNVWIKFIVEPDGTFIFISVIKPLDFGGKVC